MSTTARRSRLRLNPKLFAVAVIASLVLGALLGYIAKQTGAAWLATTLETIGSISTKLLTFTVLPLIFTAIVVGINSLRGLDGLTEVGFLLNSGCRGRKRAAAARQAPGFMLLSWHDARLAPVAEACLGRLDPVGAYERKGCRRPGKDPTLPPIWPFSR